MRRMGERSTAIPLGLLALAAMCLWGMAASAQDKPLTTVRFGSVGGLTDAGIYLADELGYFKDAGLKVVINRIANGSELTTALATDQLDVAGISVAPAAYAAIRQGLNIRFVGDKQSRKTGMSATQFVVRKGIARPDKADTLKALKGKKIGVSSDKSISFMQVENLLEMYGLPPSEAQYVTMPYPNMVAALASGAIDGAQIIEPFLTQSVDKGITEIVSDMIEARKGIGGSSTVPITYSEKFAQNRPLGVAFMVAYMRAVRVYVDAYEKNIGKDKVVKILAQRLELPEQLVAKMNMPYLDPNQRLDPHTFEVVQDYYLEKKWLRDKVDIAKLVDNSFAEEAIKTLGEYK